MGLGGDVEEEIRMEKGTPGCLPQVDTLPMEK